MERIRQVVGDLHRFANRGDDPDEIRAELRSGQAALAERDEWLYNYNPMAVPLNGTPAHE